MRLCVTELECDFVYIHYLWYGYGSQHDVRGFPGVSPTWNHRQYIVCYYYMLGANTQN